MGKASWLILLTVLAVCAGIGRAKPPVFEYPSAVLDIYDADGSCWTGMDASGAFPARVVPEQWLVGPPPSVDSAVTLPVDHWIDLAFSGRLVGGDGNDIVLTETGRAGEQALLFVTDGADQEYLLTKVAIGTSMKQDLSVLGIDLEGVLLPFAPRAIRLVALDLAGQSPGFDLSNVQARVSHDCEAKASCPNPVGGATGISPYAKLTWVPGCSADRHVIYFGEVASQVGRASPHDVSERAGTLALQYPPQPRDANTFEPPALGLGRTYYWRVDEAGVGDRGSGTLTPGDVWSFTVADHLVIDDFEGYDLKEHFLYETWQTRGRADMSIEQAIALSCRQSMLFRYQYDSVWSSEVVCTFAEPQDWVRPQAKVLEFMVRGAAGNVTKGRMYVAIGDGQTEQRAPYAGDLGLLAEPRWHACRIALSEFKNVNLANVTSIAIGLCPATTDSEEHGTGTLYIDDILLRPVLGTGGPQADLTADGTVDYQDLQRLAKDWLYDRARVFAVAAPNEPILWYDFEGNAKDRAGTADGEIRGRCDFHLGVYGQAIHFMNEGDAVTIPEAASVFGQVREAITIAFWQQGEDSTHLNDTLCCSNYVYGVSNPAVAIHLGCWRNPGQYRWDCGSPWSFGNRVAGWHQDKSEWAGRWNHWAFTKDIRTGRMEIYLNGELYDSLTGANTPITGITSFEIGSGWYGRYDGMIDDFRVYNYALSPAEIAHVATRGTGVLPQPPDSPADLNADGAVNLRDLAVLATQWLQTNLWP
ncbi:MAG: LamG domain-containing protein [Phycisphaerae bacterium]|nr:LamG domain-containing protein [Phycisphaerae bacterium]